MPAPETRSIVALMKRRKWWCPGPDSNRHGVASEGFSYPLQLSLLSLAAHLESGLSLCHVPRGTRKSGRGRQVSTLSRVASDSGLSSGLQSRGVPRGAVSPNLTPFTPAVSEPGAQIAQVPCVYQFRHPGCWGHVNCKPHCRAAAGAPAGNAKLPPLRQRATPENTKQTRVPRGPTDQARRFGQQSRTGRSDRGAAARGPRPSSVARRPAPAARELLRAPARRIAPGRRPERRRQDESPALRGRATADGIGRDRVARAAAARVSR
jgi:hypothetical protein